MKPRRAESIYCFEEGAMSGCVYIIIIAPMVRKTGVLVLPNAAASIPILPRHGRIFMEKRKS
jgi:hypothetical protein